MTGTNEPTETYRAQLDSPIGVLTVIASDTGLRRVLWEEQDDEVGDAVLDTDHPVIAAACTQLREYFRGDREVFELPLDLVGTDFQKEAWLALASVPYGETTSYGEQAERIGRKGAFRAVGAANGKNPVPIVLPCHRIVGANGALTGFAGGLDIKQRLLALEQDQQSSISDPVYAHAMALNPDTLYTAIAYGTGTDGPTDPDVQRELWKWEAAVSYRIFAAMRWGQLGDGHITCRDPERRDCFWMLAYGVPFRDATVNDLILIGPDGSVVDGPLDATPNIAGYNIHHPLLEVRQDINAGAHVHTAFGTPWSANVEPFRAISQESCSFVFNQAIYEGEDLEVDTTDGGYRIAEAMGTNTLLILRNHGLLTGGQSPAEAVGWFVIAERVAEVHVKAPEGKAISDEMAKHIASSFEDPAMGWRTWQWLARDLVPDPTVVL